MEPIKDRRRASRVESASEVLHREYLLGASKPNYARDKLVDITADGVSFSTAERYEEGCVLELRLMIYGWDEHKTEFYKGDPRRATDPLVALAEVAQVQLSGRGRRRIGARFVSIDEWHRDALSKYLQRR